MQASNKEGRHKAFLQLAFLKRRSGYKPYSYYFKALIAAEIP